MSFLRKKQAGFTIVELLIVIVVIAILAAISIVAYTGIQNRANDTAVQNDLSNFAKKIQLHHAEHGEYPVGGSGSGDSTTFPGVTFSPSKTAYYTDSSNFTYCTGAETASGQVIFQIRARSKSGNTFMYRSSVGMQNLGSVHISSSDATACTGIDTPRTRSYGYNPNPIYLWFDWTNG